MDNRRIAPRKKLTAFTPVRDAGRGILLGFLGNLTLQGALVIGEKPLDVDQRMVLTIEFPDDLPGLSKRSMTIAARVARCAKDRESDFDYNIGFEFIDVQAENTRLLTALIDRYQFSDRL